MSGRDGGSLTIACIRLVFLEHAKGDEPITDRLAFVHLPWLNPLFPDLQLKTVNPPKATVAVSMETTRELKKPLGK